MKAYFCILVFLSVSSEILQSADDMSHFDQGDKAFNTYIELLSSKFVDNIFEKHFPRDQAKVQGSERNLKQIKHHRTLLDKVKIGKKKMNPKERRLYESITSSFLIGNNDDTTTTNYLSLLIGQQKTMQNMRAISSWLNDLENNFDESREAINRRVSDIATGLQRRNMLLGHYNNAGLVSREPLQ